MFIPKTEEVISQGAVQRLIGYNRRVAFFVLTLTIGSLVFIATSYSEARQKLSAKVDTVFVKQEEREVEAVDPNPGGSLPAPQASPTHVVVNFDDLPPLTDVSTRYNHVVFSSPGLSVYSWPAPFPANPPNAVTRGTFQFPSGAVNNHFADFVVSFPQPVNDLKFYVTGTDNVGTIALTDVYQNQVLTRPNIPVPGGGAFHPPVPFNAQSAGLNNITKIVVHHITDHLGISFDDFSFTVPAPSPGPSPSPSPSPSPTPPPPTNLKAIPEERAIRLQWTPPPGVTTFNVKRNDSPPSTNALASVISDSDVAAFAPTRTVSCITNPCVYPDIELDPETTYSYVVSAINGPDSNEVSAKPLPRPGCEWKDLLKTPPNGGNAQHIDHLGWSLNYRYSSTEGLVVSDVYLNGRKMANRFSIPYFKITTRNTNNSNAPFIAERGELRQDSSRGDGKLYSRLIDFKIDAGVDGLFIKAVYGIDNIPGTPDSCLKIAQHYEFYKSGFEVPDDHHLKGRCEPSGTISTCTKFRPVVTYSFHGGKGESLSSINLPQRLHFQVRDNNSKPNTYVLTRDKDGASDPGPLFYPFSLKPPPQIPVIYENKAAIVRPGSGNKDMGGLDNFHQTNHDVFVPPVVNALPWKDRVSPGCPECVHMHWRWSTSVTERPFVPPSGAGQPLVFPGSTQSLDIAIVLFRAGKEERPDDYGSLVSGEQIAELAGNKLRRDAVLWYSPHGFSDTDTFFWNPSWFNSHDPTANSFAIEALNSSSTTTQDGPVSVTFGDVYRSGTTSFGSYDLTTVGPLPPGYAALNNAGHLISTSAIVSGPHIIKFGAASVTDQTAFNKLRIFQLQSDPFDPDKPIWVDCTILAPDTPAADFSTKTLSAKSEALGVFAIGQLVENVPPDTAVADLSVSSVDSLDPITAGNNLTYTMTVLNNGPQPATEVVLVDGLSADVNLVAINPSQGTCKSLNDKLYCSVGSMPVGGTVTVTMIVTPTERTGFFPAEGKIIHNAMMVKAKQTDNNPDNNSLAESTTILPNPNQPPTVSITGPMDGGLFAGPANVLISAVAKDTDGSIAKVQFVDNNVVIGEGTASGNNQFVITAQNLSFGPHTLVAVATDNGGRFGISEPITIIVNGPALVNITSPVAGMLLSPGSNITITANASHPSGTISEVEFFANDEHLGEGVLSASGQYSLSWNKVPSGNYSLVAVATDGSGITTTSSPINITVDKPPTVVISTPAEGAVFPSETNISVSANAEDPDGTIARVDFYANGVLIGSASDIDTTRFTATWRHVPDGFYTLTAVATDNLGLSSTSPPVRIAVNTVPASGQLVWFDDSLPAGATKHADGDVDWYWVDANPGPFSGTKSHQSRNFAQLDTPNIHQHYFDGATQKLPVNPGDKLFTYVFLDINNMPREIMLQWNDGNGWEHRAYWGQNRIGWGTDGTPSRRYMGPMPTAGQWVRLEVPANLVGLEGTNVSGMAFTLDAGRATWDLAGKATFMAPAPQPSPVDFVWVDDAVPPGSTPENVDDQWEWLTPHVCGQQGHRSFMTVNGGSGKFRSHGFRGAQTPMNVLPGDVLFTHVFLDANNMPNELVLQWQDSSGWEHRAFWGENLFDAGITGTESRRFMGGLPPGNRWVRLEVPASYVGLEGKAVSGMAFGFYSRKDRAGINWDCAGKSSQLKATPLPLTSITKLWRLVNTSFGANKTAYAYSTNDLMTPSNYAARRLDPSEEFYVHPNQAAGTVPVFRYKDPNSNKYFYSTGGSTWTLDGIAFYVYPDPSTPGTVPVFKYHYSEGYFLTINPSDVEITRLHMQPDSNDILGYVYQADRLVPAAPSHLYWEGDVVLRWKDNSANETGFKVERFDGSGVWSQISTVSENQTFFKPGPLNTWGSYYRVRATNSFGDSAYSNSACGCWVDYVQPPNTAPEISISSPVSGDVVAQDFTVSVNVAFDNDGAGTIAKVELYADGNKLGESTKAPYWFVWNNAPAGLHTLTAVATDTEGATTTSSPVNVTVGSSNVPPSISITSPANGAVFNATDTYITINATASDADGSISKVEFFQGATNLGEDSTAPYSFAWSNFAPGSYSLTAIATDNLGATATSGAVNITVGNSNVPPTISVTAPANGAVFNAPATVTITASATDSDGSISKVEFFQNLTKLGEDSTAPYSFVWSNVAAGSYSLTAKATDNLGATATSDPEAITVNGSNVPPSVSITAPTNGAVINASNTYIAINATASDADGSISKVEFFQGATKLGEDSTAPYSFAWSNFAAGSYSLTAMATDNLGATATSGAVNITVGNSNVPPTISVTAPANGAVFNAPATVTITASATDSDGSISKVEFFQNLTKLGEDSTAPYSFVWSNVAAGSYSLTAKATDNLGATATSDPEAITVGNSNAPPSVSITAPTNGAVINATNTYIAINATASDADGSISKVEFFQGATKLGEDSTAPYSFAWSNFAAGNYSLTAKATDNLGATTTSGAISITVNRSPVANAGGPYSGTAGTAVMFNGGGSSDPEGPIAAFSWNFGDGGTASGIAPAHPYTAVGTYTVTLTVTDSNGTQASANTTVTITSGNGNGNTSGYIYRRSITLDHTRVPNTDQTNFPILISGTYPYLATVANSGNVRNANGYDIIFTSDFGCTTRLNHEMETYNPTSGAANYWVKVPTVSSTSDTVIYMCYGNPNIATDQSNKTAVWDSNYRGVWHLPNGSTLSASDSTANGNHGAISGPTAASGRIDGGLNSFNAADHINAGSGPSLNITGDLTITAWIKMNSFGINGRSPIAYNSPNSTLITDGYNFLVGDGNGATKFIGFGPKSNGNVAVIQNVLDVGAWYHVVVVSNGANPTFYVNGANVGTGTPIVSNPSAYPLYIGNYPSLVRGFDGIIDELRISDTQRTAEWIATEYNNQSSPGTFYIISAATVANQPPVANAGGPYSGTAGQSIQFNGGPTFPGTGGSYDPDGTITSYAWNFGDGGTASGPTPMHVYSATGTYTASLTVTDNGGAQSSANATVTVSAANQPPVANAGGPYSGTAGTAVQFNGGGSSDPEGPIAAYSWNFGDGGTASGIAPSHTYTTAGNYTATLTVTDNNGAQSSASAPVAISSAQPAMSATFVSQTIPTTSMVAGQNYNVAVTMKNTGSNTWTSANLYRLGSQNPQDNVIWNIGRVDLPASVAPGGQASFNFTIKAPATPATYNFQWRMVQDGVMWFGDLTPNVVINVVSGTSTADTVWVEDALPAGAVPSGNSEDWNWINSNPAPVSGSLAHQSNIVPGLHQHFFYGATSTLAVGAGDKLFAFVYLDPVNMPSEVMLQWNDGSWEHRAYWGANNLGWGTDGTDSRRYMGPLPAAGGWVRLEVAASAVGLEGHTLNGMAFSLWDGRATWDRAGKSGSGSSAPTAGLVGYWKFDENSGATAVDSSGSGNTGTLTSGPSWIVGQRGAAVNFDGVDDYVQVGPRSNLVMSNAASFSAWIYPTANGSGIIVNKENEYEIARFPDGTIQWAFANSNPGWAWINTGYVASLNQWTHVAVTYDGGSIKTYINGTLTHTYAGAGNIAGGPYDFRIGGRQCCQQYFPGRLDEVRVYNRALTATEVTSLPYGASAANQLPVANAGGPYSGLVGTAVQFNGSGSDPDGIIAGYSWNFGNGGSGTGATSSHAYSTAGSYTATLTVTDNSGAQSSANATVTISNPTPTPTPGAPPTYYQASADFSAVQGQRNWYYLDSTGAQMVYLDQWGGVWQTPNTSVYLGGGWGHPGEPADAVRQWRAPGAGSIRITGTAFDSDTGGGDGVIVSIRKDTQVLWERTIENGNTAGFSYDVTTNVAPGDPINFVITRRSNTYWDSTGFDPTIAYTANGGPPTAGLVGHWKFDENYAAGAADSSASGIHGTLQNGPTWTNGRSRAALNFDGADDMVSTSGLGNVTNNFTLSFWALPTATHEIDGETNAGYGGVAGQKYALWPAWQDTGRSGAGVSVGTNGVSVYEHAANYMPATLVHSATLSGWTHITVVYENRQPRLYLNGNLVKTGITSPMSFVHLNPYYIGGAGYGYFAGKLDEILVYNRALTATEVATLPFSSGGYSAEATADFSATQNPTGSWSYGYKSTGGLFTLYSGTSTGFGAGTTTWALPGQTCCPMVTRNTTGATHAYPAVPQVVQPADVLNLHPGPNNERSIVRWAAPAAGTYSIQGRFQGIDTVGTTTDVLVTHNGTTVFSGNVNGYTSTAPFSLTRTVGAGDTIEFSVGFGSNGTYNSDSTGLSATITAYGRMNVAQSATGAVASASSTYNASYPASGANNGDRKLGYGAGGAWHSSTNTFPQWLQIDFNGTKTIDEVDVFTLQNSYASPAEPTEAMTFTLYGLTGFEVQYWNGSAWVTVPGGSISGNNKVWRKITFAPITTSKIRVLTTASVDSWTRVTEVEAWGTPTGIIGGGGGNTNGYAHRRSITIDHNKVANTQADFPVLFSGTYSYLATAANGGNVQNANGHDVVFTSDSGCANKLNHEVETYSAATGAVNYWVKVPTVSHTSDSVFYMCYGNSSVSTDQSNKTAVWDGSYKGVWHLPNGASLSTTDSTASANHGSSNSASPTAGRIGGAASYNGAGQSTVISNPANFDVEHNQAFSVEFWLKKPLDTVTNQTLISKKNTYWTGAGFDVWTWAGSNGVIFDLMDSAGTWYEIGSVVNVQDNAWHHIVCTYDGSSNRSGMKMYVDGVLMSTGSPLAIPNTIRNTYDLNFGTNSVSKTDFYNGSLDEVRFSGAARSADWIKTQYNNQSSPASFYAVSASGGG